VAHQKQRRMMHLGAFVHETGQHVAAWRHPKAHAHSGVSFAQAVEVAQTAERGKFDLLFLADSASANLSANPAARGRMGKVVRFEPMTILSALAAVTRNLGLVATSTTTFNEPYTLARQFASLDQISGGRAGWNLVTSLAVAEAYNFGRETHPHHGDRYARAREFAKVVLGLWDSFEDGAVIADKDSGIYFDAAKLHFLNHKGKHFAVRGPLTVHRSPQGHPVIVQAGQSDDGRDLAGETAEITFTVQQDFEAGRAFYADIKRRAAAYGRHPDSIKVMPGVMTVIGQTHAEAEDKYERLQALLSPELAIKDLSSHFGFDMSKLPLDGPVPDPAPDVEQKGRVKVMVELARRENLTVRQLYKRVYGQRGHRVVIGTAAEVADALEQWFRGGAADGFNILPLTVPRGIEDIVDMLIPELQRRGLFRTEYEGKTLRENLGLPFPHNRLAVVRKQKSVG
jgi:N-acetyl-S-(2-succino)cysteine monooxygenase